MNVLSCIVFTFLQCENLYYKSLNVLICLNMTSSYYIGVITCTSLGNVFLYIDVPMVPVLDITSIMYFIFYI